MFLPKAFKLLRKRSLDGFIALKVESWHLTLVQIILVSGIKVLKLSFDTKDFKLETTSILRCNCGCCENMACSLQNDFWWHIDNGPDRVTAV